MTGMRVEGGSARFDRPHQGRVALITGGSRGIGQSVAVELARRGAHVVIGARTDQNETAQLVAEAAWAAIRPRLPERRPHSRRSHKHMTLAMQEAHRPKLQVVDIRGPGSSIAGSVDGD